MFYKLRRRGNYLFHSVRIFYCCVFFHCLWVFRVTNTDNATVIPSPVNPNTLVKMDTRDEKPVPKKGERRKIITPSRTPMPPGAKGAIKPNKQDIAKMAAKYIHPISIPILCIIIQKAVIWTTHIPI